MDKERYARDNQWENIMLKLVVVNVVDEGSYARDVQPDYNCNRCIVLLYPEPLVDCVPGMWWLVLWGAPRYEDQDYTVVVGIVDVVGTVELVVKAVSVEVGIYLYCRIVHNNNHLDLVELLVFSIFPKC